MKRKERSEGVYWGQDRNEKKDQRVYTGDRIEMKRKMRGPILGTG